MPAGCPARCGPVTARKRASRFGRSCPAEALFERICRKNEIRQLLTKPYAPATTGHGYCRARTDHDRPPTRIGGHWQAEPSEPTPRRPVPGKRS